MNLEERLVAVEKRLQKTEDQLEIMRLISTSGHAVDSGEGDKAAHLWIEGGGYDIADNVRLTAYDGLAAMFNDPQMAASHAKGSVHLFASPRITLQGDLAEAVTCSFVIMKQESSWYVWRAAANHFKFTRTPDGWRIVERFNRPLDGSKISRDTLRKGLQ